MKRDALHGARAASNDLVMAWALDRDTGQPRYILELGEDQRGARCNCVCASCRLPLTAVNAARNTYKVRPHFRHPDGAEKDLCLVLAGRAAVLSVLNNDGYLRLPRRRQSAVVAGLSGEYYEAWVHAPSETVRVASLEFSDSVEAYVTLDDGRQLRVMLVGGNAPAQLGGENMATIELVVDDPAIAAMRPEELRERTRLLVEGGRWCWHWQDDALLHTANRAAHGKAQEALDWLDDASQLPDALSREQARETLLHVKAKEILQREKRIVVPEIMVMERGSLGDGSSVARSFFRSGRLLELDSVVLERYIGDIKPDVIATTLPAGEWPGGCLLIEISVTHGIDEARRARIKAQNLPTLEIDISLMGGKVTESEFTRLIVEEVAAKRWVRHPAIESEKQRLRAEVAAVVAEADRVNQSNASKLIDPRAASAPYPGIARIRSQASAGQRHAQSKEGDFWLKGKDLEVWIRTHPVAAEAWFGRDKK